MTSCPPSSASPAPLRPAALPLAALAAAGFVAILFGGELFSVSAGIGWAGAGLLDLGPAGLYVVDGPLFLLSAWVTTWIFRATLRAERRLATGLTDADTV